MAETYDKVQYSDLIAPDDSIKQLISQLSALNSQYGNLVEAVRANAKEIVKAMKDMSASTKEGREKLDDAAIAASRLEKAQKELAFSMSETGKQVAFLKSQTASNNKMSADQASRAQALVGSYNKLKLQLKDVTNRWKALSDEERAGAKGDRLLEQIHIKKERLLALDSQLKLHVEQLTQVQKAEQKLAYLMSEEGQRLIELKKQISAVISGRTRDAETISEVEAAQKRLNEARSKTNVQINELNRQTREANTIAKLQAKLNISAEGSYDRIAAQYELNKIKLNGMSKAERESVEVGQKLEQETQALYKEMVRLQEATGNHKLSVGNYTKAWNGLGMATNQVIRELPAAAVGINTFFLGISNNIPILIDEINKVRAANKAAIAAGKPTTNVMKQITGAIFNWQTGLIILITYLSMHGKEVIDWAKKLYKGADAVMTLEERLDALDEELKTTNGSYGQNIVKLKNLQREWKNLSTQKEQLQWIRDNKTEFDQLDISINNVVDAENVFVNHTEAVITALKLRAKAAAAQKLASERYEKALLKRNEAETAGGQYDNKGELVGTSGRKPGWGVQLMSALLSVRPNRPLTEQAIEHTSPKALQKERVEWLDKEARAAEKDADAFFDLAAAYNEEAAAALKAAGIEPKHKKEPKGHKRTPQDLTDTINKNEISLRKKYEMSITALLHDEYVQRRKEAVDATMTEVAQLMEKYRKNEEYVKNVGGKYKKLTGEQKQQIAQQQQWIQNTVINARKKLAFDIEQIEKERQMNSLKIMRETIDWQLEDIAASISDEKALKLQQLEQEEKLVKETNATTEEGGRSEAEITAEYAKKRLNIIAGYDKQILALRKADIDAQLEVVKKGSQEELDLLLRQNELARQQALTENRAKPAAERTSETNINNSFDKNAKTITGTFQMTGFEEAQAAAKATFEIVKHSQTQIARFTITQEKERWEKMIQLAKSGALDWSQAQIDAAEATVKGLERELKDATNFIGSIADKGIGGAIMDAMGFNEEQIDAMTNATNIIIENIEAIMQAEVDAAQQAVDAANERVEAAQTAYDAELEARANGYANNVATAKKELQQEKKNQQEKQKLLEAAQRRQEAVQTAMQCVSLITASAELWSSFASIPIVGPALAIAAIAGMWASFAVAKVKAAQATKSANQEYGEGGIEFLEGGSHASGNDIDLQTKNSQGKNMKAEGGEALAIINKRNTRKYKKHLPDIIDSLNKGTFEDKYMRAFETGDTLQTRLFNLQSSTDLSRVERSVEAIRKQGEQRFMLLGDGTTVEIRGNVTRYYR